ESGEHSVELPVASAGDVVEMRNMGVATTATRSKRGSKYKAVQLPGEPVAGRPTTVTELRGRGKGRERLYTESATNLLLERQQFDGHGNLVRVVAFEKFSEAKTQMAPAPMIDSGHPVQPRKLVHPYRAPKKLAADYERIGAYKSGPSVQVVYSD